MRNCLPNDPCVDLQELVTPSAGCDAPCTSTSLPPVNYLSLLPPSYFVKLAQKLHQLGTLFKSHIFDRLLHFLISTDGFHSVAFHGGYLE